MAKTPKRRLVTQLPAIHQTDTLKNFFAATVDELFQPGESEAISGYIGQKPVYYNAEKDFYIAEPTPERAAYQLEPAMISSNTGGVMTDTLCYDDLINYLRSQGAAVDNHSRLFEGDYYSWAPPVDLDKLNNFVQYVWMGGLTDEENRATLIDLRARRALYVYDGVTTTNYPLPPADAVFQGQGEFPIVLVNGVPVAANIDINGDAIISTATLVVGDCIETIRYGDITKVVDGLATLNYSPFLTWQSTYAGLDDSHVYVPTHPREYKVGELAWAADEHDVEQMWVCIADHTASSRFLLDILNWELAVNATNATSGTRVRLIDGIGLTVGAARPFILDGVGEAIKLTPDYTTNSGAAAPHYIVIDRRSRDDSPWTRRNLWVHQSTLDWTGKDFIDRRAKRPIIEFLPNIELFNYGTRRLEDVQGVLSNTNVTVIDNWDINPADGGVWDTGTVLLSHVNGQFFAHQNGQVIGSVVVDDGYVLQPNDRLFVHQAVSAEPALNNLVYRVVSNPNTPLPSGAVADVMELVLEGQPERGDIIRVGHPGDSVFSDPPEYWFDGIEWQLAQTGAEAPLFMLYDSSENALNDQGAYLLNDFEGSHLFSYKAGTGTADPVLGFPIVTNAYAQPVFQIDSVVNRVTYASGKVSGYYYHHILSETGGGSFSNNWFPVAAPSTQALVNGVYEIPLNLQANPENLEVDTISRNEWFDHFSEIMTQQDGFEGHPYSVNNWRDTAKVLGNGNKILQHRSPLLKTMMIAANANYDLPNALRYSEQEYSRFRNKFVQTIIDFRATGTLQDGDPPEVWVEAILDQLRLNKTSEFPFSGSTMAGGQYFIPATPSSFGLARVSKPVIYTDNSYSQPITFVRGHDGTSVPTFGDMRDPIMLALEQRIYDNIPAIFKTEDRPLFDLQHYIRSKFVEDDGLNYDRSEIDRMLAPFFQRWSQVNGLDYRTNNGYDPSDPFTWNFGACLDRESDPVPGNWRGIYQLWFDTDRPHIAPWEMLGFCDKPSWWQAEYGLAPYTRGNTKLWDDLRGGLIRQGVRAGTDPRYARPDLDLVIPVDEQGALLDPIACGIILHGPSFQQATAPWKGGDVSPVESLWRMSQSYSFAQAQVSFLIKPSRFVEQGWDTTNLVQDDTGQWIFAPTGNRPLNSDIYVHGELNAAGSKMVAQGVQQWISDYMVGRGQAPSSFGEGIRGLSVKLAHKMAGFTTSDNLRVLADNFGLVPAEDVDIRLYRSPSTREEIYSGVVVEWSGMGWRVIGYDTRSPTFHVIPGLQNGPKGLISLSTVPEPVINGWRKNTYYPVGTNVSKGFTVYKAIKGHTSSSTFDPQYWEVFSNLPTQAPRVVTYGRGDGTVADVPYGTTFTTYQEVADFLLGHQRYLEAHGWVFDQINPDTQEPLDWSLATREFLAWAQVQWQPGNFIALSPAASGLKFHADHGTILDVLSPINGVYGMIDRAGMPIRREDVVVNRIDSDAMLLSKNSDVFGARVNIGEIEHVLVFSNKTIFNDIIYAPLFNLRQPRLRLIARRSTDWTGRLDIPGYILIGNDIKPNFDKAAVDLLTMFDVEKADNATLRDHARHVIGYDSRDYLSSLVLSEVEQFEFYQGMIHQKGAPGAFDKLLRSDFIEQSRDLKFFEEWAIKIDEYGAIANRNRVAFLFGQSTQKRDPQYTEFRVQSANSLVVAQQPDWIELIDDTTQGVDIKWVERPDNPLATFPQRSTTNRRAGDLPAAGYVRLDEVDQVVFSTDDIMGLYNQVNSVYLNKGEVVWVHNNLESRDVSKVSATDWHLLGDPLGAGHWDATTQTRTAVTGDENIHVLDTGERAFHSTIDLGAPYLTDDENFTPVPGVTYNISFSVRKVLRETNGITPYVRPGFDAFKTDSVDGALGVKAGFGFTKNTDMIDTSNWILNRWYTVECEWTVPISPDYVSARGRLRLNRSYPEDLATTPYSDAEFEVVTQKMVISKRPSWDALKVYHLSATGAENTISNVVTAAEDANLSNTTTRIYTVNPHGLTATDRGLFMVIDGDTFSDPTLQGVQRIWDVGDGWIDFLTTGKVGYDFAAKGQLGPPIRILRSIHFTNLDQFNSFKNRVGVEDGDIAYVDGSPWRVYQRGSISEQIDDYADGSLQPPGQVTIPDDFNRHPSSFTFWKVVRSQPNRMDGARLASSLIYNLKTKVSGTSLQPEPLTLDHLTVVAPLAGIIPGRARAELDYITDYDPANYNFVPTSLNNDGTSNFGNNGDPVGPWGPLQTGKLWWDLSRVRFLETETDNVSFGLTTSDRYNTEVQYRIANWGQIAPATSVDVYEWTRSNLHPLEYAGDTTQEGEVYKIDAPSWVEAQEYEGRELKTFYYFWVKGRNTIPVNKDRHMSAATVARFITSPVIEDQPWIAPIMPNGVLTGGISPFVDDTFDTSNGVATSGTVLQIEVDADYDGVVHDQWMLLRPKDERSLPPEWLWEKLRDSLVGFDQFKTSVPPSIQLPSAVLAVNKEPVWFTGPDPDDVPIDPSLR